MSFTGKPDLTVAANHLNDGFWPELSNDDLLSKYRVPSNYADAIVPAAINLASIRVNEKLQAVKAHILELGHATFQAYVTANRKPINGADANISAYEHAVYSRAKAGLIPQLIDKPYRAGTEADEVESADFTESYWLDESQAMIALLKHNILDESVSSNAGVRVALL